MTIAEVDIQGKVHFPKAFGIKPRDKVILNKMGDAIVIKKVNKEVAETIRQMTRDTFKDVDFKQIEKEREDRE